MKHLIALALMASTASAGNLVTEGLDGPHVTGPNLIIDMWPLINKPRLTCRTADQSIQWQNFWHFTNCDKNDRVIPGKPDKPKECYEVEGPGDLPGTIVCN